MQQSFQDQQLSIISSSDDEPLPQQQKISNELQPDNQGFLQSGSGQIQLIYTMFILYRQQLNKLAERHECKIKFSISNYFVEQADGHSKEKFSQCIKEAQNFMNSIIMLEITWLNTQSQVRRFFNSPYIIEILQKKNIRLVYFRKKLFAVSREYHIEVLKKEVYKVTQQIIIFSIRLKRSKKGIHYYESIYKHVSEFMKLIFTYYQKFFVEREVVVRLCANQDYLLIHGLKAKYVMQSKFTLKNSIESMVCLFVRDATIDVKHLKNYLAKAAIFPVYVQKYNNSTTVVITKDNVLRQLIQKSPSFLKYLGIQSASQQEQQKNNVQVGFHLVRTDSVVTKIDKIKQICLSKCYDIQTNYGIRFLKRTFSKSGQQTPNTYRELLVDIIVCVEQFKIKYEVIKDSIKQQPKKIQQKEDGLKYQILGGKQAHKELSKLLRRDVLVQKVQMKKKFMIAYNVLQTNEEPAYWITNKNGEEGEQVKLEQIKKGLYFKGLKKINNNGEVVKLFEQFLTIL